MGEAPFGQFASPTLQSLAARAAYPTAITQHRHLLFRGPRTPLPIRVPLGFGNIGSQANGTVQEGQCVGGVITSNQHAPVMNMDFRNGSSVHIRAAFNSADPCRGLSADLLVVDEFQDLAAGDLPVLTEMLSHATNGRTILAGTPKDVGNHLQAMFSRSTANEWLVPCPGCGRNVTLDERCLGPEGVICSTCQHSIDPRSGVWVPRNPAATWGEGFWVNHLFVPWVRYQDILDRQATYDLVLMKNEVLGLPTTTGDFVVTRGQLEACCQDYPQANSLDDIPLAGRRQLVLGVDWGGGGASRTVLTLGFMRSDYCFQICRLERFDSRDDPNYVLEQVASRCRQFQVAFIAADGGGNGTTLNRLLLDRLGNDPNLLYGILYSQSNHAPQRDGLVTTWTVHRTASIAMLFTRVKKQSLHFPRLADCDRFLDDFSCEIAEHKDYQREVRYIHPDNQQDDALHSATYALLVATRYHNAGRANE